MQNTVNTLIVIFGGKFANFCRIVYPVHTPAAVDYIMFNFMNFYLIVILYEELLLKKAAFYQRQYIRQR
jgi:hypothetical protein